MLQKILAALLGTAVKLPVKREPRHARNGSKKWAIKGEKYRSQRTRSNRRKAQRAA